MGPLNTDCVVFMGIYVCTVVVIVVVVFLYVQVFTVLCDTSHFAVFLTFRYAFKINFH